MNILIVDDHTLFREGLVHVLVSMPGPVKTISAATARAALEVLETRDDLDVILVDLALPDAGPFEVLQHARRLQPAVPCLVVSATENRFEIDRAQALGAAGYVFKSSPGDALRSALTRVMNGELVFPERIDALPSDPPAALTVRQLEVLGMLARGLSNREISDTLGVAENTVKVHLATIYRVLGVTKRTHALLKAQQMGLLLAEK